VLESSQNVRSCVMSAAMMFFQRNAVKFAFFSRSLCRSMKQSIGGLDDHIVQRNPIFPNDDINSCWFQMMPGFESVFSLEHPGFVSESFRHLSFSM
jgi:hypothetical protein